MRRMTSISCRVSTRTKIARYLSMSLWNTLVRIKRLLRHLQRSNGRRVEIWPSKCTTSTTTSNLTLNNSRALKLRCTPCMTLRHLRHPRQPLSAITKKYKRLKQQNKLYDRDIVNNNDLPYLKRGKVQQNLLLAFMDSPVHKYDLPLSQNHLKRPSQKKTNDGGGDSLSNSMHENKLPLNLLHGAAEYNKMLITNGKYVKRGTEDQIEGFIDNLEYLNDDIFQKMQQESAHKNSNIQGTPSDRKKVHSFTHDCSCNNRHTCQFCVNNGSSNGKKLFKNEKIVSMPSKNLQKQHKKRKQSSSKKKIKKSSRKVIASELEIDVQLENKQSRESDSYLSQKKFHIDELLYKSLIMFEQRKRYEHQMNAQQSRDKQLRRQIKKRFDEEVRYINLANSRSSVPKRPKTVPSKADRMKNYSRMVEGFVKQQLKKDSRQGYSKNIVKALKESLMKKDQYPAKNRVHLSQQEIQYLKKKHQSEALYKIEAEKQSELMRKYEISMRLAKLKASQRAVRQQCPKHQFKPTQQMIAQAFYNPLAEQQQPKKNNRKSHPKDPKK